MAVFYVQVWQEFAFNLAFPALSLSRLPARW